MIYLIWSIINISAIILFYYVITILFLKKKYILSLRLKMLIFFCVAVVIGAFNSLPDFNKKSKTILLTNEYSQSKKSEFKLEKLEDNLTFDINMSISYTIIQDEYIPVEGNSNLSGLVIGFDWDFKSVSTESFRTKERNNFVAYGILEWNFLGLTVYRQLKSFKGTID